MKYINYQSQSPVTISNTHSTSTGEPVAFVSGGDYSKNPELGQPATNKYNTPGVGSVHAVDAATGVTSWMYLTGGWSFGGAATGAIEEEGGNKQLVISTSYDWLVHALREQDGQAVWKFAASAPIRGAALVL